MKTKNLLISIFIGGSITLFTYVYNTISDAKKGMEVVNNRQVLLNNWYMKNNPAYSKIGPHPSENELREIRINAFKGFSSDANVFLNLWFLMAMCAIISMIVFILLNNRRKPISAIENKTETTYHQNNIESFTQKSI